MGPPAVTELTVRSKEYLLAAFCAASHFQAEFQRFSLTSQIRGQAQIAAICSSILPIGQNFTAMMIAFFLLLHTGWTWQLTASFVQVSPWHPSLMSN